MLKTEDQTVDIENIALQCLNAQFHIYYFALLSSDLKFGFLRVVSVSKLVCIEEL